MAVLEAFAVCANCGREVPPDEGADVRVSFRDGVRSKKAVLCEACAGRLPGVTTATDAGGVGGAVLGRSRAWHRDSLEAVLARLPERHRRALSWFAEREGHEVPWPQPLPDGTLLACRPKGIYKPAWSKYTLSVRESLDRSYPDEEPIVRPDGSWTYRYFQENLSAKARDKEFTNASLLACTEDSVPVGVFRQVARKPKPRYHVLGIAFVRGWREGFFELESALGGRDPLNLSIGSPGSRPSRAPHFETREDRAARGRS